MKKLTDKERLDWLALSVRLKQHEAARARAAKRRAIRAEKKGAKP